MAGVEGCHHTFSLRAPLRLSWRQIYRQFGLHPGKAYDKNTDQAFRYKVLRELKKIKLAWPGLNYATAPGVLIRRRATGKRSRPRAHRLSRHFVPTAKAVKGCFGTPRL